MGPEHAARLAPGGEVPALPPGTRRIRPWPLHRRLWRAATSRRVAYRLEGRGIWGEPIVEAGETWVRRAWPLWLVPGLWGAALGAALVGLCWGLGL